MFGSDGSPIVQYVVIFAVIFTALAGIVFVVRRLTGQALPLPGRSGTRGRQPRLGIVDVYELDRARQLILLRRDNVEHLLLVGGPNDVVVERNIQRGQRPLPEAALRAEPAAESLAEPLPDPLAGAGRLPEPQRALPEVTARRSEPLFDPGFKMPVVVPAPVPGSGGAPPVTLPLDAGLLGGDEPGQEVAAPLVAPPRAAANPSPAPATTPPERERFSARRILGRTTLPPLDPRPEPASERKPDVPAPSAEAEPPQAAPPPPRERRSVDASALSDMARQLQAALARPSSAVTPAPLAPPRPPEPAAVDPVAAAMASAPPAAAPAPPPVRDEAPAAVRENTPPAPPAPPAPPTPAMPKAVVPPVRTAAVPTPPPLVPPAAPPPAPRREPEPSPEANAAGNPFSVEEIEAEFARLLGRPLDKRG